MTFQPPRLLSAREINTIRGKASVGHATIEEIQSIFGHIDCMEMELDELQGDDRFGTEGWRHSMGIPE